MRQSQTQQYLKSVTDKIRNEIENCAAGWKMEKRTLVKRAPSSKHCPGYLPHFWSKSAVTRTAEIEARVMGGGTAF
ncbi:hypothetical protein NPIL_701331 [Nephila pilipes]|uniref:Uncharacterized protein n=1 Tax=Nephila pilipes TaxID=299642 RepID=A0A8X6MX81_NEPPI|nr:hypothetical protein NPIL_701331 [Nephila pilipes]